MLHISDIHPCQHSCHAAVSSTPLFSLPGYFLPCSAHATTCFWLLISEYLVLHTTPTPHTASSGGGVVVSAFEAFVAVQSWQLQAYCCCSLLVGLVCQLAAASYVSASFIAAALQRLLLSAFDLVAHGWLMVRTFCAGPLRPPRALALHLPCCACWCWHQQQLLLLTKTVVGRSSLRPVWW